MKRKILKRRQLTFLLFSALFFLGCILSPAVSMAATKLKLSMIFPPSSYTFVTMNTFAEQVKERTNGEVEISVHPPGALAKPMEQFDMLKRGAIDLAFSAGLMHARKIPEALFEFSLPFTFFGRPSTMDAANQFYEFFYEYKGGAAFKKFKDVYAKHGIAFIGAGPGGAYGFMVNFPVKTLKDFEGKKIRTFGTLSVIVKELGGAPVTLANTEQFLALQRGTIDGTIYTYYSLEAYKLKEVVKHIVYPPVLTTPVLSLYANQKALDKLSKDQQKIIYDTFDEQIRAYSKKAIELEVEYIKKAEAEGVTAITLSDADAKKLQKIGRDTWPLAVKRSDVAKELVEMLKEYLAEKGGM